MTTSMKKFAAGVLLFATVLTGPTAMLGSAWAHGDERHGAGKGVAHMEAMHRLKEQIPEEYRVMDRTPVTPAAESLARGKELYLQRCAICHGKDGKGKGAAAGMNPPPANFLDVEHSSVYGPGEKFWIIGNGSAETGMPGFAADIEPLDRWHLVNYILSLQRPAGNKK